MKTLISMKKLSALFELIRWRSKHVKVNNDASKGTLLFVIPEEAETFKM
jgi:hypothetical protein